MAARRFTPVMAIALLVGCGGAPKAAAPAAKTREPTLVEPSAEPSALEPPPSHTVPMRYETKRIEPRSEERRAWVGRPIDLDVKDADIQDVLRLLSDVGHANIVVADSVSGRVTIRMKHVPWDQALDVIARAKGLAVEHDANVTLVTRP